MISQLEDFLKFLENNCEDCKTWKIADNKNNGHWKQVDRNIVIMEYLKYKMNGNISKT